MSTQEKKGKRIRINNFRFIKHDPQPIEIPFKDFTEVFNFTPMYMFFRRGEKDG
jgi:hypothetical protein